MGRVFALTALALATVAVGCGGKPPAVSSACISIFLVPDASGAQIRGVRHRLEALDVRIASLGFVTKKQALGEMRHRYPYLLRDMPYNPLPASFRVRPRFVSDERVIVRALDPKPPGVHVVKYVGKRRRC